MHSVVFRLLAGIIGTGIALVAVPASKYSGDSFWPEWLNILSFFEIGFVFLIFAITGWAWPRFYGQDIDKNDDNLNDR